MVPEKHQKLMVHIRRMTERERKKRGEERGGKAGVEVRVSCIYRKKDTDVGGESNDEACRRGTPAIHHDYIPYCVG